MELGNKLKYKIMRKFLFLLLTLISLSVYGQDIVYNCRIENPKDAKVSDTLFRKIYKLDNRVVVENYFVDSEFEKNLIVKIDRIEKRLKGPVMKDWAYCSNEYGKYIIIGIGTTEVDVYDVVSEIEVYHDRFTSLK